MKKAILTLLLVAPLVILGCSGNSHVEVKSVGVTIAATGVQAIDQGQQVGLTATVTNDVNNQGVTWSLSGTGCSGAGCGTLTNTTTTGATYLAPNTVTAIQSITVTATSIADSTKFASITVSVAQLPTITLASLSAGTIGVPYPSTTLTASGGAGTLTWSISSGTLPAGLSLNSSTGAITGTPSSLGTSNFTVKVTDSANPPMSATKAMSITINPATLTVTTSSLPAGTVGMAYTASLTASGGTGAISWSVSAGSLPAGLTLGASTGAISGTPTTAGTSNFTVKATDSASPAQTATKALSIVVTAPLSVTTTSLPSGAVGTAYSATLQSTGGTGTITWAVSVGSLPAGLSLNATSGMISGTPTTAGASNFTVKATDASSPAQSATKALSISINPSALTITTTSLPNGIVGTTYATAVHSTGGTGTVTWSLTAGSLPAGLTLDSQGSITGTPTATGASNFTVKATDSGSPAQTATSALSITINPATLAITTTTLPNGTAGTTYSATLMTSGGTGSILWTLVTGTLPNGLTLDQTTGVIGGTPSAAGTSNFTVKAADSGSPQQTATQALSLTIGAGTTNNSPLNGSYAFMLGGFTNSIATMGGTFVADGAGNLTSGVLDNNDPSAGPSTNVAFTGTYALGNDHRGTLTINAGALGTFTFSIAAIVDGTGNASKGVLSSHDSTTKHLTGEFKRRDTTITTLSAIAGSYAFGVEGRDANNSHVVQAGVFTLASTGSITAGEWDYLGSSNSVDLAFTGSATAPVNGRGTFNLSTVNGTVHYSYFPISATEHFVMTLDSFGGFSILHGQMLRQTGPFSGTSLNASMTFYALGEGPSPGASTNVRVGTMGPLTGNPGNYTMTYTGADGTSPIADSKFFTCTVAASGRVTTTASATGATSVFYLVGPNQGFVIGGTITASDSTRKVGGYFEPQTGGPYSAASASGDFVFATVPPPGISSTDITSGVVHLDGAGNATAVTDSKGPGPSPTLTTGAASTWTLTQNGSGSPLFLLQSSSGDFLLVTLVSPTKAYIVPEVSPTISPNIYLLEQ
jgi:Putative Ig domain